MKPTISEGKKQEVKAKIKGTFMPMEMVIEGSYGFQLIMQITKMYLLISSTH